MSHTCALVRRVPYTALPSDVRRVAGAPVRIDFVRTHAMVPSEMVMVEYATEAEARALQRQRPCIGGEALQVECLSAAQRQAFFQRHYAHWPSEWLAALDIGASYPMQSVVLRHLPFDTTAEKLEKKLQRHYALGLQIPPRIDWHMSQLVRPTTPPLASSFTVLKLPPLHFIDRRLLADAAPQAVHECLGATQHARGIPLKRQRLDEHEHFVERGQVPEYEALVALKDGQRHEQMHVRTQRPAAVLGLTPSGRPHGIPDAQHVV